MNSETAPVSRTRSRASMLFVLALFAAPVVLAWLVFFAFPDWRPTGSSNHGHLVEPVRLLPAFEVGTLSGDSIDETFLRGKWTFVYLAQGDCDKRCIEQLYNVRQARLTQGKNIDRLQRLLLWQDRDVSEEQRTALQEHFPGQVIVSLNDPAAAALVDTFSLDGHDPLTAGRIYLIDPLGNLMMSYEPGDEPRGMVKDLQRLLKYSGLG